MDAKTIEELSVKEQCKERKDEVQEDC